MEIDHPEGRQPEHIRRHAPGEAGNEDQVGAQWREHGGQPPHVRRHVHVDAGRHRAHHLEIGVVAPPLRPRARHHAHQAVAMPFELAKDQRHDLPAKVGEMNYPPRFRARLARVDHRVHLAANHQSSTVLTVRITTPVNRVCGSPTGRRMEPGKASGGHCEKRYLGAGAPSWQAARGRPFSKAPPTKERTVLTRGVGMHIQA
jgi:hypothetical protein